MSVSWDDCDVRVRPLQFSLDLTILTKDTLETSVLCWKTKDCMWECMSVSWEQLRCQCRPLQFSLDQAGWQADRFEASDGSWIDQSACRSICRCLGITAMFQNTSPVLSRPDKLTIALLARPQFSHQSFWPRRLSCLSPPVSVYWAYRQELSSFVHMFILFTHTHLHQPLLTWVSDSLLH